MGRKKQVQANVKELQKLNKSAADLIMQISDSKKIIAYTMRLSGCTYSEIAEVFGTSRQGAEILIKKAKEDIIGEIQWNL